MFATRFIQAVAGVMVARLLGPALRGDYALVALGVAGAGVIATCGLEFWAAAAVAGGAGTTSVVAAVRAHLRRSTIVLVVLVASAALVVGVVAGGRWAIITVAGGLWTLMNAVSMLYLAVLGGQRRMGRVAAAQICAATLYAGGLAVLLRFDADTVAWVVVVAAASTGVLALVSFQRVDPSAVASESIDRRDVRRVGTPAMFGELANLGLARLDLIAVGLLMSSTAVGRYAVAVSIAELLWIIPAGVSQVLLPQVAADRRGNATAPLVCLTALVGLGGAAALSLAGFAFVPAVFGTAFEPATSALPWLCAAAIALSAWRLLLADLTGRGNTRVRISSAMLAIVAMLAADAVLVPAAGIAGAGAASLIAYSVALIVTIRAWTKASGTIGRELLDVRRAWSLLVASTRVSDPRAGGQPAA